MNSIKTKNKLYRQCKKTGNVEHESVYKQYRNNLNKLLIEAERSHYQTLFNENKSHLKKSWRILKQVINKKKDTSSCSKFQVNQEITTDKTKIANGFNQYFINIGPTLADKIPKDNKCPTTYMENRILESMLVTAIVYGGKFKFAVATIWWVMVSLSVQIGWIWRHLLESDRLPFPTVSFLLPETLSRLSCDSSLILEPATMMKEAWYSKVCIQCHPCLIIGYLVLYFGLLSSMYTDLSVVIIILRRLTNLWRYFVGISWGFFHLSSGNLVIRENIFRNL